jgi:hypothetical protein
MESLSLLTEIFTDEQLIKLYTESGFLIVVNYTKNEIRLHTIDCMLADPISSIGVKPSKVRSNKTGEFWYSKDRDEIISKTEEIAKKMGFTNVKCPICNP